jgi:hypothetical protein
LTKTLKYTAAFGNKILKGINANPKIKMILESGIAIKLASKNNNGNCPK